MLSKYIILLCMMWLHFPNCVLVGVVAAAVFCFCFYFHSLARISGAFFPLAGAPFDIAFVPFVRMHTMFFSESFDTAICISTNPYVFVVLFTSMTFCLLLCAFLDIPVANKCTPIFFSFFFFFGTRKSCFEIRYEKVYSLTVDGVTWIYTLRCWNDTIMCIRRMWWMKGKDEKNETFTHSHGKAKDFVFAKNGEAKVRVLYRKEIS